jgi:hypothetical protein
LVEIGILKIGRSFAVLESLVAYAVELTSSIVTEKVAEPRTIIPTVVGSPVVTDRPVQDAQCRSPHELSCLRQSTNLISGENQSLLSGSGRKRVQSLRAAGDTNVCPLA